MNVRGIGREAECGVCEKSKGKMKPSVNSGRKRGRKEGREGGRKREGGRNAGGRREAKREGWREGREGIHVITHTWTLARFAPGPF